MQIFKLQGEDEQKLSFGFHDKKKPHSRSAMQEQQSSANKQQTFSEANNLKLICWLTVSLSRV